jgi:hypothetical protein
MRKDFKIIDIKILEAQILVMLILWSISVSCSVNTDPDFSTQYIQINFQYPDSTIHYIIEEDLIIHGATYYYPYYNLPFLENADSLGYTSAGLFDFSDHIPFHIRVAFTGKGLGTYYRKNDSLESILYFQKTQNAFDNPYSFYNGMTEITEYGKIGERVKGSFSGNTIERSTGDSLTVNGDFNLLRGNDFTFEML